MSITNAQFADECLLSKVFVRDVNHSKLKKSNYVLNALYDTFEPAGEIVFPRKINITVSGNRRTFKADFTINRVTFNENVQLQAIDRSRFVKVSIDQLLKK